MSEGLDEDLHRALVGGQRAPTFSIADADLDELVRAAQDDVKLILLWDASVRRIPARDVHYLQDAVDKLQEVLNRIKPRRRSP